MNNPEYSTMLLRLISGEDLTDEKWVEELAALRNERRKKTERSDNPTARLTGYQHYRQAEELSRKPESAPLAQIHATLALAAATADPAQFRRDMSDANGKETPGKARAGEKAERIADAARAFLAMEGDK
ncbi:hypothetical protein [Streptomyces coelicoflavus]|uniref:hypothetical protein n=1 Tax=Streptomyces coelicoflavus TaxID=285562 RepID=UPI002E257459